ncbi:hypothetical protein X566_13655 [Afipia sp. P52-10]|jgi:hypothetical protein|uniref:hypothetical protein n=1 Tax=Afipia sp. P52-10 TaxID=1429916 RepID=UPI0003DF3616|nr:hypothetical protein [Afipia sp. P52-10]ETR79118.1 hypothetical protein X566_13655 [Afipia sp. P52-10]
MANVRELRPTEAVPSLNHVLVVKLTAGLFEVSGTAGAGRPDARFLKPSTFDDQQSALQCARDFATANAISTIHVKGFHPH